VGVTVLGAAGFVGGRLVERLGGEAYTPAKGDPAIFERDLGTVFYCAGLTADYAQRPFDTVEAHASLVAELARRGRFERFVYLSSTRLYDSAAGERALEDEPLRLSPREPRHLYDLSKALGENIALTQMGGRGAAARLSNVFDWRDGSPGFLSEWLIRARDERELAFESSPHAARDYIHVDDVVSALIAIARDDRADLVNVASGELTTNGEIAEVFEAAGWRVRFAGDARPARPPCADIAKLRDLGVDPRPVREVVGGYLRRL
jgi:nucleoside-diphosphate-sugar epimerase